MKYLIVLLSLIVYFPVAQADPIQDKPFAIVELFNSEGSSNCSAADLLIGKLTSWARQNNEPVYPLSFYVDYRNNLGWRDVFGREEFSQRQSNYARIFKDQGGRYVPQLIVNGSDAFAGSDQEQLQKDLGRELSLPASVTLHISFTEEGDQLIVKYDAQGFNEGDVVNIALLQKTLSTDVTAGENAGRTLHHNNVVREFQTIPLTQAPSQVKISLSRISDVAQALVIAYVQNPQTLLIEAAKQLDLGDD